MGKSAFGIVTGGTGALGSSIALACLASGAQVAVTYRSEPEWERLREQVSTAGLDPAQLAGIPLDLTDPAATGAAFENLAEHSGVDFLVCAAGGFSAGTSYSSTDAAWNAMLNLNLRTAINAIRPLAPAMIQRQGGVIITVSSAAILNAPGAGIAAYAVAKEAVRRLSEILAIELRPHGIAVHCILPGTMDTPANRRAMPGADPAVWLKTDTVAGRICELVQASAPGSQDVLVPIL